MSNTRIVIILLVVLMAIFIIAMSFNLIEKPNEGISQSSSPEQQLQAVASLQENSVWLKAMNKLLSPFATSLTPKEVSMNCSKSNQGFFLSAHTPKCEIHILGFSDKAFKKLSLKPNNPGIILEYWQDDKNKPPHEWPKGRSTDNIDVVVLADKERQGKTVTTITLNCINCSDQKNVEVIFE